MKQIVVTDHQDLRNNRLVFDHVGSPNRVRVTIKYGNEAFSQGTVYLTPAQIESLAKLLPKLDSTIAGTTCVGPGIAVV